MTGAAVVSRLRVPYVIAYSGEAVRQRLAFVEHRESGGVRLSYHRPRHGDWAYGVLRARVRLTRRGTPQWRLLNTARQWACMEADRCQVCGLSARDPESGRIPWILTATAFRPVPGVPDSGFTSAPATCWGCVREALDTCPQLGKSSGVYTVAGSEPAAVLADMFSPGPGDWPIHTGEHNVFVGLDEFARLPRALATQLVVQLHDLRRESRFGGSGAALV